MSMILLLSKVDTVTLALLSALFLLKLALSVMEAMLLSLARSETNAVFGIDAVRMTQVYDYAFGLIATQIPHPKVLALETN